MKIWIMSDVHIELSFGWDLPPEDERPDFDVLVMAGDLTPRMERGVRWLRERVPHKPVIYIAGNHEAYRCDIDRIFEKACEEASGSNVHVMENQSVVIAGVRFIAATLWTDFELFGDTVTAMRSVGRSMNDYRLIRTANYRRPLQPIDTRARHVATRAYIERELSQPFDGPTVVVTHHAPYRGAIKAGHESDVVSAGHVSDLSTLIEDRQPDLWVYGHTHRSDDARVGKTRIVSNAKGYGPHSRLGLASWENLDFDRSLVVEL
jgi:predicted phosphodiesterase